MADKKTETPAFHLGWHLLLPVTVSIAAGVAGGLLLDYIRARRLERALNPAPEE